MEKPKRWRVVRGGWNARNEPWFGGHGIEEDDEKAVVPALVCWFFRGRDTEIEAQQVVDAHNKYVDSLNE